MTIIVHLHKDENMQLAKTDNDNQPLQLDLWQMLADNKYSNSIALYQSFPDVFE